MSVGRSRAGSRYEINEIKKYNMYITETLRRNTFGATADAGSFPFSDGRAYATCNQISDTPPTARVALGHLLPLALRVSRSAESVVFVQLVVTCYDGDCVVTMSQESCTSGRRVHFDESWTATLSSSSYRKEASPSRSTITERDPEWRYQSVPSGLERVPVEM